MIEEKQILRKNVALSSYDFTPIIKYGKEVEKITFLDANLFLEIAFIPPERNAIFQRWKDHCEKKRVSFIIAVGHIKQEVMQEIILKQCEYLKKTPEEVVAGGYTSCKKPTKIYGFFRRKIKTTGNKAGMEYDDGPTLPL